MVRDELDPAHERAVGDALRRGAEAIAERPLTDEEFAKWLENEPYPILTEDQLAWRRSREVRLTESFENTLSLSADIYGRRVAAPLL